MQLIRFLLFLFLLIWQPNVSGAQETKSRDFYLSIHSDKPVGFYETPNLNTEPIFKLPPNSVAIQYLDCKDLNKSKNVYSKYINRDDKKWCQIIYREQKGWVQKKYLRPYQLKESNDEICSNRRGNQQIVCSNYELVELKQKVVETYEHAEHKAKLNGDREKLRELNKSHKLWEHSLDKCHGEIEAQINCLEQAYKSRITYLQTRWFLVSNSKSKQYSCNGQKYTVTSFNTPYLPSILVQTKRDQAVMIDYQNDGEILYIADSERHAAFYEGTLQIKWSGMMNPILCDEIYQ
jgi:uncharacterized protein